MVMMDINNFMRLTIDMGHFTPMFFMFYAFFHGLFFKNPYMISLAILTWVDFRYIGPQFKRISREKGIATPRPFCKSLNEAPGCNGMPSGHTETMALFFSYVLCYTLMYKQYNENYFLLFLSFIGFIFMGIQRVISNMHTKEQVFWGGLIGLILGPITISPLCVMGKFIN